LNLGGEPVRSGPVLYSRTERAVAGDPPYFRAAGVAGEAAGGVAGGANSNHPERAITRS
jgi:hypothetical protein